MKLGNIVSVTSINEKAGKTFVLRNLAGALAEEGKKVLILDFTKNITDYIEFFEFNNFSDLSKVYKNELSLQSVKMIYPKNRGISIISNKEKITLSNDFLEDFLEKIKKTYDYIFIEETKKNNNNINYLTKQATHNIIIIDQGLSSIKKINKIIKKYNNVKNHSILVNNFDFKSSNSSGILMDLEDLFKIIDSKFLGIVEEIKNKDDLDKPSFLVPYTNLHLSFNRISKRIIENKYLNTISNLKSKSSLSMEILYKKFDIIEKKSF